MILHHTKEFGRDRVDANFVKPLIEIFMEKIEKNLEKIDARNGRSKFQNFRHLL
jgi:hypothetical protein